MTEEEKEFFEEEYDTMYGEAWRPDNELRDVISIIRQELEGAHRQVEGIPYLLQELTRLRIELEEELASKANAVSEAQSQGYSDGRNDGYSEGHNDGYWEGFKEERD